ncbi:CPA2 (predicted) [Pycnogonum litorale]
MPGNEDQLLRVYELESRLQLDIWKEFKMPNKTTIDVRVAANYVDELERELGRSKIEYECMIEDVQKLIDDQQDGIRRHERDTSFKVNRYNKLEQINNFLRQVSKDKSYVSLEKLGSSYERKDILAVKIRKGRGIRRMIFLECGMHAREWISPAACTWIIDHLTSRDEKKNGSSSDAIIDRLDWYIVPVANPDGYHHSWTKNRMWRKTRSKTLNSTCYGVDGNRNWDIGWGKHGTSKDPCRDHYGGSRPFSETEVRALRDKVTKIKSWVSIFVSLHSYGQAVMIPYGYTVNKTENYKKQIAVARSAALAMHNKHDKRYASGQIPFLIGTVASGSSVDWVYKNSGVENVFAVELRDRGKRGFLLPQTQIQSTAEELLEGLKAMINKI